MEASRFGFVSGAAVSPAYKFDPTDEDIVAHYLLPRALGLRGVYAHAVIEDDPLSLPPWDLLLKHHLGDSDHAFFVNPSGRRGSRSVAGGGGIWEGQKGDPFTLTLVQEPGGGAELDIVYKKYNLTFCICDDSRRRVPTGFVMHEYKIISPPLDDTLLTRIRVTAKAKKYMADLQLRQAEALDAAGDQQLVFPVAGRQMVTADGEETHALNGGNSNGAIDGYCTQQVEAGAHGEYQSVDQQDPSSTSTTPATPPCSHLPLISLKRRPR